MHFIECKYLTFENISVESSFRDSLTIWYLCALFPILLQFYAPFNVKREKMDNFMCLLEFICTKRLKVHSQAIPDL